MNSMGIRIGASFTIIYLIITSCSIPTGLKPISGIEGLLTFPDPWPDHIHAVALVVLESFELEKISNNLITYSDPVETGTDSAFYFVQLIPGQYHITAVGLMVPPALFAAKLDSFLKAPQVPLVVLDDLQTIASLIVIQPEKIRLFDRKVTF
jgi:hypothetical protein